MVGCQGNRARSPGGGDSAPRELPGYPFTTVHLIATNKEQDRPASLDDTLFDYFVATAKAEARKAGISTRNQSRSGRESGTVFPVRRPM